MAIDLLVQKIMSGEEVHYTTDVDEAKVGILMFSLRRLSPNLVAGKNARYEGDKLVTDVRIQFVAEHPGIREALHKAFTRIETPDPKPQPAEST